MAGDAHSEQITEALVEDVPARDRAHIDALKFVTSPHRLFVSIGRNLLSTHFHVFIVLPPISGPCAAVCGSGAVDHRGAFLAPSTQWKRSFGD
jgi:hypothetical protein